MSKEAATCVKCGYENAATASFCAECGSDLAIELEGSEGTATTGVSRRKRDRFKIALLSTAVPVVGLSILSSASAVSGSDVGGATTFGWGAAAALWLIALVAGAGLGLARKHEIASGIVAGIGIGAVALAVTCFANLQYY